MKMLGFLWKSSKPKRIFDKKTLRKNNISVLILDERWNSLFASISKTPEILKCEENLRELLKEQARLNTEAKDISRLKKTCMDNILKLAAEAFENNNEDAKKEMQACEKEIKRINDRMAQIEQETERIPERIKETNVELLEHMVNVVYFRIRANQKRVRELEMLIEDTKNKLKVYIDEKASLSEDYAGIYSYFHDLLGPEELERLDREFFKNQDL